MDHSVEPLQEKVEKPWGREIIFTPPGWRHVGKLLEVKAGGRWSFQYHDRKEECFSLISGKAVVWLEDRAGEIRKLPMELNKGYHILPGQKHRVEAVEDSLIVEASDPETGVTVRISDDYSRTDETEEVRKQPNRGWRAG